MMDRETRERLEEAGFRVGSAAEFLGLSEEERRVVELRLAASRVVRERRERGGLTQQRLARLIGSSQSRVAKLETGGAGISLDLVMRAVFAVGGDLRDVVNALHPSGKSQHVTGRRVKPIRAARSRKEKGRAATKPTRAPLSE
jgi:transcriptional regulator with XRE-family HTH domain